jgi:arylsulfatase A-like enzyme
MNQPNILYIHSHDTGRYIEPYGYAVPTPTLQRLAESGMLFRQAFCCAPTCGPSRAGLHTGTAPHTCGMDGLTLSGFQLRDHRELLAQQLNQVGYASALAGFQHLALKGEMLGYTEINSTSGASRMPAEVWATDWLRKQADRRKPFFLDVGLMETHRKGLDYWRDDQPLPNPDYLRAPARFADTPETRRDWSMHVASAKTMDDKIASVLQALEETGLAENTLVIYTTDHGIAFPMAKANLTDEGVGVGLILRAPFLGRPHAAVSDVMVSHLDIFPTIGELAGMPAPDYLQGQSLLPLWKDGAASSRDALCFETTYHGVYDPQRAIRTNQWKYIRRFADVPSPAHHVASQTDQGAIRTEWIAHGWPDRLHDSVQLYDLHFDATESLNLAGRPEFAPVIAELDARLQQWMKDTGDPLVNGPVVMPMGLDYGLLEHGQPAALPAESSREHFTSFILEEIAAREKSASRRS